VYPIIVPLLRCIPATRERELIFHKLPIKEEIVKNSKLIADHAIKKFDAI